MSKEPITLDLNALKNTDSSNSGSTSSDNGSTGAQGTATDKKLEAEMLIAMGKIKELLAKGHSPEEFVELAGKILNTAQGFDGQEQGAQQATGSSAAPGTGTAAPGNPEQEKLDAQQITPEAPAPSKDTPSTSELVTKALNESTKLFELALMHGPAAAMLAKAAVSYDLQGSLSPVASIRTSAEPDAVKEKIAEVTATASTKIEAEVNNSIGRVANNPSPIAGLSETVALQIKGLISNMLDPLKMDNPIAMQDYGTGKFTAVGTLQPASASSAQTAAQSVSNIG